VTEPKSPLDAALDVLVYAPVGLALTAAEEIPKLAEKGRARLTDQLSTAKVVGQFVVTQGRKEVERRLGVAGRPAGGAAPGEAAAGGAGVGGPATGGGAPAGGPLAGGAEPASTGPESGGAEPASTGPAAGGAEPASTGLAATGGGAAAGGPLAGGAEAASTGPESAAGIAPVATSPDPGYDEMLGGPRQRDDAAGAGSLDEAETDEDPDEPLGFAEPVRIAGATGPVPSVDGLAIPGYDSLSASQVVQRLAGLSPDELAAVGAYESTHRGRRTILTRVSQLQGS
jgi:hypothetical protein